MARIGRKNEMKVDFCKYNMLFQAIAGYGKTTTAYELGKIVSNGNEEGTIVLNLGREPEPLHIDGIFYQKCLEWSDLEEAIEELCDNRSDYPNTKLICLDTVDEMFRLCEAYVVSQYNKSVQADKKVKTIKQVYGGFGAGERKVVDTVIETVFKLNDYNYGILFLGHTKIKTQEIDIINQISTELLTSNLPANYYNCIKDKVATVCAGYIEREFADVEMVKDAFTKKQKKVGDIISEKRVVSFRDETFSQDLKSYFVNIPNKIDFSPQNIYNAIMEAIKKDLEQKRGFEVNMEELQEQQQIDQAPAPSPKKEKAEQPTLDKSELLKTLQAKCADKDTLTKAMTVMKEKGYENFKAMSETDLQELITSL